MAKKHTDPMAGINSIISELKKEVGNIGNVTTAGIFSPVETIKVSVDGKGATVNLNKNGTVLLIFDDQNGKEYFEKLKNGNS